MIVATVGVFSVIVGASAEGVSGLDGIEDRAILP